MFGLHAVSAETQFELNKEACDKLQKADDTLNKVYQQILAKYQSDKIFTSQFVNAQKKWINFRDAFVASKYIPQYQDNYGSVFPMCQCLFLEDVTNDRIKQLRVWLNGIEEGDVCIGSVK